MKVVNVCFPCSCGAMLSFVSKLGYETEKSFCIPCRACNTKRNVIFMNYAITLTQEYNKPSIFRRILNFMSKNNKVP